jgi:phage recombination protein Bet
MEAQARTRAAPDGQAPLSPPVVTGKQRELSRNTIVKGAAMTFSQAQDRLTLATDVVPAPLVTADQRELVMRTVAQGATPQELELFLYDCARQGVHPLDRLLHFTKRGGRYTPVTSIDLMRIRASETGDYAGNDEYEFTGTPGRAGFKAVARVWRLVQGQRVAFTRPARWEEYCPPAGQDHMWRRMPHVMLGKCAEAQALRAGFPRQLHGSYVAEEMDAGERREVSAEEFDRRADLPATDPAGNLEPVIDHTKSRRPGREAPRQAVTITQAQAKRLWVVAKAHGWTEIDVRQLLQSHGVTHTADIRRDQYDGLIAALEAGVEGKTDGDTTPGPMDNP